MKKQIENYNNIKIGSIKLRSASSNNTTTSPVSTPETEASKNSKKLIFKTKCNNETVSSKQIASSMFASQKEQICASTKKFLLKKSKSNLNSSNSSGLSDYLDEDTSHSNIIIKEKCSRISPKRNLIEKEEDIRAFKKLKSDENQPENEGVYDNFDTFDDPEKAHVFEPKNRNKQSKKFISPIKKASDLKIKANSTKTSVSLPPSPPSSTSSHADQHNALNNANTKSESNLNKTTKANLNKNILKELDELDFDTKSEETNPSAGSNVKKFKLLTKRESSSSTTNTLSTKTTCTLTKTSTLFVNNNLIKHKIFNSKSRTTVTNFKLNFDEDFHENESNIHADRKAEFKKSESEAKSGYAIKKASEINLRSTRKAYECEQLGEEQAFLDDFFYLLDGLNSSNKLSDRCLSAMKLAEECLSTDFRMNLRSVCCSHDQESSSLIEKIFQSLNDCTKYKSLTLCTSLILFALTQDKLALDLDKSLFDLLVSMLSSSINDESIGEDFFEHDSKFSYLSDLLTMSNIKQALSNKKLYSSTSSLSSSPTVSHTHNYENVSEETCDELVNSKIFAKCRKIYEKLTSKFVQHDNFKLYELNFNRRLIALDCLLNLNMNTKKVLLTSDYFRNELRDSNIIEMLFYRLKILIELFEQINSAKEKKLLELSEQDSLNCYLLAKFKHCISFLETLIQVNQHDNATDSKNKSLVSKKQLAIKAKSENDETSKQEIKHTNKSLPVHVLNQNYMINFGTNFLADLLKNSLKLFYEKIHSLIVCSPSKTKDEAGSDQAKSVFICLTGSIKQIFLLMINLTYSNELVIDNFMNDYLLLNVIFEFVVLLSSRNDESNENSVEKIAPSEQFDILIMILGVILNLCVNSFHQKLSLKLISYKNKACKLNAPDIILNLYLTKEKLVSLAEDDQENEFKQLNEQIESQNAENINLAIMNSIHKAGKHMEDHIIAAHCALILGYMILNDSHLNRYDSKLINTDSIKAKIKENSFKFMAQIIRKFIVFMKIMKITGFSADEHIHAVLDCLEKLEY